MRGRTVVVAALVAVALAAIGLVVLVGEDGETIRSAAVVRGAQEAGELAAMQQQVVALRAQMARLGRPEAPARAAAEPTAGDATELSRAERRKQVQDAQRRAIAFLGSRVDDGPRDPAWSSAIAAELTTSLEAASGSALRSVTCSASLCRAELSHPDRRRVDRFIETLSGTLHLTFQLFFERVGDGLATTVFVARDGQRLAELAKQLARGAPQR